MISLLAVVTQGWEVLPVKIQVARFIRSFPQFIIEGLPAGKKREVRERLLAILQQHRWQLDRARYVITITPTLSGDTWFENLESSLLLSLLAIQGVVSEDWHHHSVIVGAVQLDGTLSLAKDWARQVEFLIQNDDRMLCLPLSAAKWLPKRSWVEKRCRFFRTLTDVVQNKSISVSLSKKVEYSESVPVKLFPSDLLLPALLTVIGGHHLLLYGSPGEGKTFSQSVLQVLFQLLNKAEHRWERYQIQSFFGENDSEPLVATAPHHRSTDIFGSTHPFSLGAVSRAHYALHFWDELSEFPRENLVRLRQVFDQRYVQMVGKRGTWQLPADSTVVATTNPCPCGWLGTASCRCTTAEICRFQQKFMGPLADRFHLFIRYPHANTEQLEPKTWSEWITRGKRAHRRARRRARDYHLPFIGTNAHLSWEHLQNELQVPPKWLEIIQSWSLRRQIIFQQVALSVADLSARSPVETDFALAYQYTKIPTLSMPESSLLRSRG